MYERTRELIAIGCTSHKTCRNSCRIEERHTRLIVVVVRNWRKTIAIRKYLKIMIGELIDGQNNTHVLSLKKRKCCGELSIFKMIAYLLNLEVQIFAWNFIFEDSYTQNWTFSRIVQCLVVLWFLFALGLLRLKLFGLG